ncbi:Sodium/hydrogen exchanger 4 [Hibiscus syriacus]|uniref:Sodium/hydrogen exchanger 4 n=1 Tax=Hibiscus syriacus TaxID=106335 RepID=A0A6A2ZJ27_HIBSY|nr:Sodium/hydrogen exchanger 4 [Hibiscus syriacus]
MEMFEFMTNLAHQHEQGSIAGTVILLLSKGKSSHILRFDEQLFFIYLFPPIIFNAGFQVKKKQLFQNFCNHHAVRSDRGFYLFRNRYGWQLVAVSQVRVWWFESTRIPRCGNYFLINSYSLYITGCQTFLKLIGDFIYLFSTSTALGVTFGLVTAYLLKTLYFGRYSTVRELAIMVLMAYLSYMLAELLDLSGILTVCFCAILMHIFAMMSFVAETFIFLYVGMDALDVEKWKMTRLSFTTLMGTFGTLDLLILLGRAAFVFPLSVDFNLMNRRPNRAHPLTFKHQVVIWWAGLMRGAVSIALAFKQVLSHLIHIFWCYMDPVNAAMITNTIIVVLFTTMVFGFLTKPLILCLLPQHVTGTSDGGQGSKSPKEDLTLPFLSFEESATTNILRAKDSLSMLFERSVYTVHYYWRNVVIRSRLDLESRKSTLQVNTCKPPRKYALELINDTDLGRAKCVLTPLEQNLKLTSAQFDEGFMQDLKESHMEVAPKVARLGCMPYVKAIYHKLLYQNWILYCFMKVTEAEHNSEIIS